MILTKKEVIEYFHTFLLHIDSLDCINNRNGQLSFGAVCSVVTQLSRFKYVLGLRYLLIWIEITSYGFSSPKLDVIFS